MRSKAIRDRTSSAFNGVICIDKPAGMTSHDVVNRVRRIFGQKRAGHTGTLDPMATGVLVVCLGHATRIVEYLAASRKEYIAEIALGLTTDTEDTTGQTITTKDASVVTAMDLREVLPQFLGKIKQIPPMVSAVHHEGKRLYELAREGKTVEREPRDVVIYKLELTTFTPGPSARAEIAVACSTGTYIRTLAANIGETLAVGAAMSALRRTRVGEFGLGDCHTLDEFEALKAAGTLGGIMLSIRGALQDWPTISVTPEDKERIWHGRPIEAPDEFQVGASGPVILLDERGIELAIGEIREGRISPVKVFSQPCASEV